MAWQSLISRKPATPVGAEAFIQRRRRRKWYILAGLAIVLAFSWADRRNFFGAADDDITRYDGKTFLVVHVVDGDTLDVDMPDPSGKDELREKTRIRLWGINAPEMPHHGSEIEPFAQEATNHLRQRVDHRRVTLTLERHRVRDMYGRLLAFVSIENGVTLNEELVATGLARADGRWEHRNLARYALIEEQARRDGAGLWAAAKKPPFQPRPSSLKTGTHNRPASKSASGTKPIERSTGQASPSDNDSPGDAPHLETIY